MFIKTLTTREEYFEYPARNCGLLKGFDKNPESLMNPIEKSNAGMDFGSAVDCLLYDGQYEFDQQFYVFMRPKPTASLETLADAYIQAMKLSKLSSRDSTLALALIKELSLWNSIKDPKKIEAKLTEDFWEYIDAIEEAGNKTVLSLENSAKVALAVENLRTSKFTEKFYREAKDVDLIYQLKIIFTYKDVEYKVMLDQIYIDHKKQTIEPADLKTTSVLGNTFPKEILKFRYDLQAELYTKGIESWAKHFYPDYTILPFKFVVISQLRVDKPYVYSLNYKTWIEKINSHRTEPYRTLDEIIENFDWHLEKQLWQYEKEMYIKGFIELK